jgi:hypothetical protein
VPTAGEQDDVAGVVDDDVHDHLEPELWAHWTKAAKSASVPRCGSTVVKSSPQ